MSLEHQVGSKYPSAQAISQAALPLVKANDTVSYVGLDGIGHEAKVKSISGDSATLEIILPDGQAIEKSGVKYVKTEFSDAKSDAKSTDSKSSSDAKVTTGVKSKDTDTSTGGRRGKVNERTLDANGNPVARDIRKFHDTAIALPPQSGEYWHV